MECSEPGLIRDEELLAYLAGERVRPVVEQHLARCPRCSTRLADYRRQELTLISKLYRWDCPPNQVLGEFHLGLLDPEASLAVKFHLRTCVPCSLELSTLGEFLSNDPLLVTQPAPLFAPEQTRTNNHHALPPAPGAFIERLLDHAGAVKRQIIAVLLPPAPRLSYQRAAASSAALWPRRYVADDFSISLQVERASGRADTFQLIGFVTRKDMSLEALQGMPVLLSSQAEQVSAQNVDELGNFVFSSLVPATYTLELQSPDSIIVIEQLTVEAQA
ncbi:MAG TPA: hypothetical protein VHD63_22955 [Ktedonobacteraceae bacterium]|nr:hypothetical protein [Ktedonobacteraceae bacterium]